MVGGPVYMPYQGTSDVTKIEAPVTVKAYLVCAFAAFGGIFFGYDTGWMSGVLAMPYFITLYTGIPYDYETKRPMGVDPTEFGLTSSQKSLMTSILSCGTFFGALIAGDAADFIGRRPTIIAGCALFSLGCVLEIASTDQEVLFVFGRLVAGGGVGFISSVILLYLSEIAPRKVRGAIVSGYQFCITLGILLANCVVYLTQNRSDTASYRVPIGIQFIWALVLGVGLFLLPESPRYHVRKGHLESAAKALSVIRGQSIDSEYIRDELAEIVANHEYETQEIPHTSYVGSWLACFKGSIRRGNSNLRRTLLGSGIQLFQQFTGINFIFYFGTTFFQQLGTIQDPFFISLVTTLVNVLSTPLSFWAIEKFGRRFLLIWGGLGMVFMQFVTAVIGVTSGKPGAHDDGAVKSMIAFICFYIFFFAVTWGPVAWVLIGELFPLPIRSRGVAISTASNWFWNTIIAVITPYMVGNSRGSANLGPKVFFIWGSFCTLSLLFAFFFVPEMKGLTLEQVDKMMEEVTARKSAAWAPHTTFAEEMRRINAGKAHGGGGGGAAAAAASPAPTPPGVVQQYHHHHYQYDDVHHPQGPPPQVYSYTPPPAQHYGHTPPPPPPQHWQHSPPPQQGYHHSPSPQPYQQMAPPPPPSQQQQQQQQYQYSPAPQQYAQQCSQPPYQR